MHETPSRSSEIRKPGGGDPGGLGAESPLQTRATFLANWSWESVIGHNRRMCERRGAQHGENPQSDSTISKKWDRISKSEISLIETLDWLRECHRYAPFLFFNGNTFADIGRTFSDYLFAELPTSRRRQVTSFIAHYIAGVLDREAMISGVESLCEAADFKPGDRVETLKGSLRGVICELLPDGRLRWKTDEGPMLMALPESLRRAD